MGQQELIEALIEIGFQFSGSTNTRQKYTYLNMTVGVINGKGKYGIAITINGKTTTSPYSNRGYVHGWAYEEAQNYVANHS